MRITCLVGKNKMSVDVVYASPESQIVLSVSLKPSATVEDAIVQSDILTHFPEIDLQKNTVGIWGKTVTLTTPVQPGDRVEIYRPLLIDPKDARRARSKRRT